MGMLKCHELKAEGDPSVSVLAECLGVRSQASHSGCVRSDTGHVSPQSKSKAWTLTVMASGGKKQMRSEGCKRGGSGGVGGRRSAFKAQAPPLVVVH